MNRPERLPPRPLPMNGRVINALQNEGTRHLTRILKGLREQPESLTPKPNRFADISVTPETLTENLLTSLPLLKPKLKERGILPLNIADFDGTLIRDSSGGFFIEYGASRGFFSPVIRPRLNQMMDLFGVAARSSSETDTGFTIGEDILKVKAAFQQWLRRPVLVAERHATTRAFYEMCAWIFAGHTRQAVGEFAEELLERTGYRANYYRGASELLSVLRSLGIETMIVSATIQPVVEVGSRYFGIPARYVRGMNLKVDDDGRFLPVLDEPVTFREGKVDAAYLLMKRYMDAYGDARPVRSLRPLFAMGDSPSKSDQQLLEIAEIAIAVEPQTPGDAESARSQISAGRPGFILDFESTIAGERAEKFVRQRDVQVEPAGKYL